MAGASVPAAMEVLAAAGVTLVAMAAKVRVAAKVRLVAREVEGSVVGGGRRTPAGRCGFWSQRWWMNVGFWNQRWWADLGDAARRRRRRRRRRRGYNGGEDVVARAGEGVEGRRGLAMCG